MTYHDFLRAVWRGANRPGTPVTFETFDNALLAALRRIDPDLHDAAVSAVGTVVRRQLQFSTTDMLRYLERTWKEPTTP